MTKELKPATIMPHRTPPSLTALSKPTRAKRFLFATLPIELQNVTFGFGAQGTARPVLNDINVALKQGKMHAFVGPARQGKATVLKLLGQVLLPQDDNGVIFVPSHLRVLHVSPEIHILNSSFLTNIIFNHDPAYYGGMDRIIGICEDVGFSQTMMKILLRSNGNIQMGVEEEHTCASSWSAMLSHSDGGRLNLARALIMNPECLVLHQPMLVFNESVARRLVALVRNHVDERGIRMDLKGRRYRRLRTVCFTSSSLAGIRAADHIYEVSFACGLTERKREDIMNHLDYLC